MLAGGLVVGGAVVVETQVGVDLILVGFVQHHCSHHAHHAAGEAVGIGQGIGGIAVVQVGHTAIAARLEGGGEHRVPAHGGGLVGGRQGTGQHGTVGAGGEANVGFAGVEASLGAVADVGVQVVNSQRLHVAAQIFSGGELQETVVAAIFLAHLEGIGRVEAIRLGTRTTDLHQLSLQAAGHSNISHRNRGNQGAGNGQSNHVL